MLPTGCWRTRGTQAPAGGGGGGSSRGRAGRIHLQDNAQANGALIIDNGGVASSLNTPLRTALATFRSLRVRNFARLSVVSTDISSFSVEQPVVLTGSGVLILNGGVAMTVSNASGFDVQ